jgi:hypothetical protein
MSPQSLTLVAVLALVAWRIVSRLRRSIGRQRLSPTRAWFAVACFPQLVLLLAASVLPYPARLAALALGVAGGVLLATYGLRKTVFEARPEGQYYTPHALIGAGLVLLLLGRLGYRLLGLGAPGAAAVDPGAIDPGAIDPGTIDPGTLDRGALGLGALQHGGAVTQSAVTLAIVGLLAGYYATYAIGLLRWRRRARSLPAPAATAARAPGP